MKTDAQNRERAGASEHHTYPDFGVHLLNQLHLLLPQVWILLFRWQTIATKQAGAAPHLFLVLRTRERSPLRRAIEVPKKKARMVSSVKKKCARHLFVERFHFWHVERDGLIDRGSNGAREDTEVGAPPTCLLYLSTSAVRARRVCACVQHKL